MNENAFSNQEIHVLFEMALNVKIIKMSPALFARHIADQTDHFADAFVRENVAYGYDAVMTI